VFSKPDLPGRTTLLTDSALRCGIGGAFIYFAETPSSVYIV